MEKRIKESGYKKWQIAEEIGISPPTLNRWLDNPTESERQQIEEAMKRMTPRTVPNKDILELMKERGITKTELAERMGVYKSDVSLLFRKQMRKVDRARVLNAIGDKSMVVTMTLDELSKITGDKIPCEIKDDCDDWCRDNCRKIRDDEDYGKCWIHAIKEGWFE